MKTKTHKSPSRKRRNIIIFIITIAVIFLVACAVFWYNQTNNNQNKTTTNHNDTQSQDQNNSKNPAKPSEGLPSNTTTTSSQVPINPKLSITIISTSLSNGIVQANAQTSGDGTCVFLYQPSDGGKPVTNQVIIENNTCSVSIPQNEFAYIGLWKLSVTYYSVGNKAEASQDVTIH